MKMRCEEGKRRRRRGDEKKKKKRKKKKRRVHEKIMVEVPPSLSIGHDLIPRLSLHQITINYSIYSILQYNAPIKCICYVTQYLESSTCHGSSEEFTAIQARHLSSERRKCRSRKAKQLIKAGGKVFEGLPGGNSVPNSVKGQRPVREQGSIWAVGRVHMYFKRTQGAFPISTKWFWPT